MKTLVGIMLACLLVAQTTFAEPTPLVWPSHRPIAEALSNGFVYSNIGLQTLHSFQSSDRRHAFTCQGIDQGVALGAALLAKFTVHRLRPDGSNDHSFFSGHTTNAMVSTGWNVRVAVPLAFSAGYMRMAANKHYLSDVLTGAAVGWASSQLCK